MWQLFIIFLMLVGAFFVFVAGLGALRMPDLFLRISATTKAATMGVGSILLAAGLYFGDLGSASRALAIIAFILLTAPVSAHMIGRAAYLTRSPLSPETIQDDLAGQYDRKSNRLSSHVDSSPLAEEAVAEQD